MPQVEPIFERVGKECEKHGHEHGAEGEDENFEEQVEEGKKGDDDKKDGVVFKKAPRATFHRAFLSDRVHPSVTVAGLMETTPIRKRR
ncbi:MAG TPA: hypothetical protein VEK14_09265 [Rhodomicrobium sp.]|nr:hypothetical protein [Rhodomicrobium sp.]